MAKLCCRADLQCHLERCPQHEVVSKMTWWLACKSGLSSCSRNSMTAATAMSAASCTGQQKAPLDTRGRAREGSFNSTTACSAEVTVWRSSIGSSPVPSALYTNSWLPFSLLCLFFFSLFFLCSLCWLHRHCYVAADAMAFALSATRCRGAANEQQQYQCTKGYSV